MRLFILSFPLISSILVAAQKRQEWTGDTKCSQLMCVAASVNGSSIDYVLSGSGRAEVGWMGIGFGRAMPNTPMVIMWANSDGSITLSQRSAPGFVMPTVDTNPPRLATLQQALSSGSTSSSNAKFAFSIPANGDKTQNIIYAFGATNPNSPAVDAFLEQHLEVGAGKLDFAKKNTPNPTQSNTPPTKTPKPLVDTEEPILLPYQRLIVAHAIFCVVGFLVFLPVGALIGRYLRTFNPAWFKGHWMIQSVLAGPTIIIGVALGVHSVDKAGMGHFNDTHKRLGLVLFVFYIAQCFLGAVIHFVKPKSVTFRPPQNYVHAIFGLSLIGLAFYQVRIGYKIEWPRITGLGQVPGRVDIIFWLWVVCLTTAYGLGLLFLKKQFRKESKARRQGTRKHKVEDYKEDD